jgi:hypothetical protein
MTQLVVLVVVLQQKPLVGLHTVVPPSAKMSPWQSVLVVHLGHCTPMFGVAADLRKQV